jgi:hypothetical protein
VIIYYPLNKLKMTTTVITIKAETMLSSSFENHRKIFAHLKAAEKCLEVARHINPIKVVCLDVLNK